MRTMGTELATLYLGSNCRGISQSPQRVNADLMPFFKERGLWLTLFCIFVPGSVLGLGGGGGHQKPPGGALPLSDCGAHPSAPQSLLLQLPGPLDKLQAPGLSHEASLLLSRPRPTPLQLSKVWLLFL